MLLSTLLEQWHNLVCRHFYVFPCDALQVNFSYWQSLWILGGNGTQKVLNTICIICNAILQFFQQNFNFKSLLQPNVTIDMERLKITLLYNSFLFCANFCIYWDIWARLCMWKIFWVRKALNLNFSSCFLPIKVFPCNLLHCNKWHGKIKRKL